MGQLDASSIPNPDATIMHTTLGRARKCDSRLGVGVEYFIFIHDWIENLRDPGMGELYVPKFAKYMERKDLVSLTIKSRMKQAEFSTFVDIMSEPGLVDTHHKQDQERFAQILYSRGVFNISYVFNEEFLALKREMPWRARLTLSRMRKDLKMIPIIQQMMGHEIKDIRVNLLRDALRPVRQSDLLCAILRNSDLVTPSSDLEDN